jgi:3-methylcrotonyl-CoA carboxylase alpha subunit
MAMFETLLIANRGEIACRIMRTARRMGLCSVAVFSEADRNAQFVRMADRAVFIGGSAPRDSYLRGERIIEAALATGAQAIHPGYGFLSENAGFAEAVSAAGLTFVGPSPAAIRAMGLKDAAKALMQKAGVPVVPGYHGDSQEPGKLASEAERIGFPVLIKAVAGGGGKGMRRVDKLADFPAALEAAQREAQGAFGDARVLLEKYLVKSRHIEVQVFADRHGHALHLYERDCSLQRRHQKVLEEAPAPGMSAGMRAAMGEAAVRAARAIRYEGAGTVEFIADVAPSDGRDGGLGGLSEERFYFMEMNTRLQVEHPVTELITGLDLVEWQLRVAAGEHLALQQDQVPLSGHAIEARVYAEDPARDYLPQTGALLHLRMPESSGHVRVDSGVVEGDTVSVFYDPMIAKLAVWDEDRSRALRRLRRALEGFEVAGLATNLGLLGRIAAHPAFAAGDVHTGFLPEHGAELAHGHAEPRELLLLACVGLIEQRKLRVPSHDDPYSPWNDTRSFRVNADGRDVLYVRLGERELSIGVRFARGRTFVTLPDGEVELETPSLSHGRVSCVVGGVRLEGRFASFGVRSFAMAGGLTLELDAVRAQDDDDESAGAGGAVKAPMPGKVIAVLVSTGDRVERGQPLLRLEAMKMEHTLAASVDGEVEALSVRAGDQVEEGSTLLSLRAEEK